MLVCLTVCQADNAGVHAKSCLREFGLGQAMKEKGLIWPLSQ